MRIPREIYDGMLAHARQDAPNECCGMLGGLDGVAISFHRATNSEGSPLRYNLEPGDQFRIMRAIEDAGEDLAAIYHSHTLSPAYPSQTDISLATYPDSLYLIVSLAEGEQPLRGFWIRDGEIEEVELTIE